MVHCRDRLKDAQKWQTSFAAYDEAVKNVTAPVVVDDEDDDHGRQALPPRPRSHKATMADLAREAAAPAFTLSLEKMMTKNQADMAKRDEKKRMEKRSQLPFTSASPKRSLRSKGRTSRPKSHMLRPNCMTPRQGGGTLRPRPV
jgi:type IV secretory pathway VirB10-like protein